MKRQLVASEEAVPAKSQHAAPCSDCPWSRDSLPGWLGGASIEQWIDIAHGDEPIDCHVLAGAECAGAAIYRANVCKNARRRLLVLPPDRRIVFATPSEFREHHARGPGGAR